MYHPSPWLSRAFELVVVACVGLIAHSTPEQAAAQNAEGDHHYAVTYSPHVAHESCHMNLGPTGATVWMRGYHFVVASIQQTSPAEGVLELGDVILGVDGKTFGPDVDPRITFGNAIVRAEADGEPMKIAALRDGKPLEIEFTLPHMGALAEAWPHGCPRSERILDDACRMLLNWQLPNGGMVSGGNMGLFQTGLLMLATGKPEYLDAARRAAYRATELTYEGEPLNNWPMGYGGILLAEYYLATGDDSVLPRLADICRYLADGQMLSGTWGHRSPASGYGGLNQPGLVAAMTLVLAQECGVEVDQEAHDRALRFFGRFAGTGAVPYGDGRPGRGMDDNGKSAMAAVLFNLAGDQKKAELFAASVADSYWQRERGHTGGVFSIIWGPLGAALAGDEKLADFLDYQEWYYALSRHWTGGFVLLPYREALTRFDNNGYIADGPRIYAGGIAWAYTLPAKHLRITGAPPSVFGTRVELDEQTAALRELYLKRDWEAFDREADRLRNQPGPDMLQARWLDQLVNARALAKASVDSVLVDIDNNLDEGGAYRASLQFDALKRAIGDDDDPRFTALEERFEDGQVQWHIREATLFYERYESLLSFAIRTWVPAGRTATAILRPTMSPRPPLWESLSPTSHLTPQRWRTLLLETGEAAPADWMKPGFADTGWREDDAIFTFHRAEHGESPARGAVYARRTFTVDDTSGEQLRLKLRTVRRTFSKVYLNGELIVDVERGQRGGYAHIMLPDNVFELLREGENVLAVTSDQQGTGNNALDVGLDVLQHGLLPETRPIHHLAAIPRSALPQGVDIDLKVNETEREYGEMLAERYAQRSNDELINVLESPVPFYRLLAGRALVDREVEGVQAAMTQADNPSWFARSEVMSIVRTAWTSTDLEDPEAMHEYLTAELPLVIDAVDDEHFWVRTWACEALAAMGPVAKDALPALSEAINDDEEWVRTAAFVAIKAIAPEDETLAELTLEAVQQTNSTFRIPNNAVAVVKEVSAEDQVKLAILTELLRQPAEGGGGRLLTEVIGMASELDPQGDVMIPLLIDAAADKTRLSLQRGNPWGAAIEALGNYGPRAGAAVPVLEAILADEDSKGQHEAAQTALDQIRN